MNTSQQDYINMNREVSVADSKSSAPMGTLLEPQSAEAIQAWMISKVAEELKIPPSHISVGLPLTSYGLESRVALTITGDLTSWLGRDLRATLLWEFPTIKGLAQYLATNLLHQDGCYEWPPSSSSLVAIQPDGSRPPFFCVHELTGTVVTLYDLARHLGLDQPLYGLQAQGLNDKEAPHARIEDMAGHYLNEIRSLQPEGPYFIGGLCFGGLVALEMAQQLQAQGQEVGVLALCDATYNPSARHRLLACRIKFHLRHLAVLSPQQKLAYVLDRMILINKLIKATTRQRIRSKLWQSAYKIYKKINKINSGHKASLPFQNKLARALDNVEECCMLAAREYVPQVYAGKVTFFRSSEQPLLPYNDPQMIWGELFGDLEVRDVPGGHITFYKEPHVKVLAEQLRTCLGKAQSKGTSNGT
ncbi:MAG: thioesterase domain-containing protein [Gammaproteobacteria bacterium]